MDNENKDNQNNRFVYKEGDIKIANSQCDFCKNNNETNNNICEVFTNGKPEEILTRKVWCKFFKSK